MEFDPNINPWEFKSSKDIYENPWIKVVEDQVIRPNKSEGIYGKIHFKNKAIGIIPLDDELNTWLVGQYRYTLNEYSWEIPTGGVPLDENTLDGAKRELKEETGLMAKKWTNLLKIHTSNSVTDEYGYLFLAEDLSQGEMDWDETEELQIKKLPLKKAMNMVMDNRITDSLSIAGILKAAKVFGL
ncbi:MAG: NUDIX hydrolase [Cyclobacteriaceae bacterium]|nr:NUDIX hydrolase [Cyclobacteriaceae bacterium]